MATDYTITKDEYRAIVEERDKLFALLKHESEQTEKLRELVRIAIEYCVNGYCAEEDECPLYESRHSCRLHTEARDLGVEVDE